MRVRGCFLRSTVKVFSLQLVLRTMNGATNLVTVCVHDRLRGIALRESLSVSLAVRVVLRARVLEEVRALEHWSDILVQLKRGLCLTS